MWGQVRSRALLFGEAHGRVVVSSSSPDEVLAIAQRHGVPSRVIGRVGASNGAFRVRYSDGAIDVPVATLADTYHEAIPRIMTRVALATADSQEN